MSNDALAGETVAKRFVEANAVFRAYSLKDALPEVRATAGVAHVESGLDFATIMAKEKSQSSYRFSATVNEQTSDGVKVVTGKIGVPDEVRRPDIYSSPSDLDKSALGNRAGYLAASASMDRTINIKGNDLASAQMDVTSSTGTVSLRPKTCRQNDQDGSICDFELVDTHNSVVANVTRTERKPLSPIGPTRVDYSLFSPDNPKREIASAHVIEYPEQDPKKLGIDVFVNQPYRPGRVLD